MKTIEKYLNEEKKYNIKEFLKNLDRKDFSKLKDSYFGVADNLETLFEEMSKYPELREEGSWVKKSLEMFKKITLGKYL